MSQPSKKKSVRRLHILNSVEIATLYGRPQFNDEERAHYFALSAEEQTALTQWHTFASRSMFILQLGYFKASQQFFTFELAEVADDIAWIQQHYFPENPPPTKLVAKGTRLKHHAQILQLHNYRLCTTTERTQLVTRASQAMRISSKPRFVLHQLRQFLADQRIVTPGYSVLQDIISAALQLEYQRLGKLIKTALSTNDKENLQQLLKNPDGLYEITRLKREPKSFGEREIKREIRRGDQLATLYTLADTILPTLDISNESVKYYASLVSYYSVYRLRRFEQETTFIYLLCFVYHRYQQMHDNLINCLTYQVYQYNEDARTIARERIANYRQKQAANLAKAGQVLRLFTTDKVPSDTPFADVKTIAFKIVDEQAMQTLADSLTQQASIDEVAWQWDYLDERRAEYKRRLRPILRTITFQALSNDMPLLKAVVFVQNALHDGVILRHLPADKLPLGFVPEHMRRYLYKLNDEGKKQLDADRYEFLVYRLLRNALIAGNLFCHNSVRFRSFEDDLIDDERWQQRDALLDEVGLSHLKKPIETWLDELEAKLEQRITDVNKRIASGENSYLKKHAGRRWTLPYTRVAPPINHLFFEQLPDIDVQTMMHFVHQQTRFLDKLEHILQRSGRHKRDDFSLVAAIVAWGTNMGIGRMGARSDIAHSTLATTSNNYIRLETLRAANDAVTDATATLPIFHHYDIGGTVHSSSDGQKFETRIHTINARHSSKYFGLSKGVVVYTLVANHVPLNAQVIGAHEPESHYVFDLLANNTTNVKPTSHSTDTHGTNHVNFALLHIFGYQFAPRYRDLYDKVNASLYGFQRPSKYDESFLLRPVRRASKQLIVDEWRNMQRIFLSLALKSTTQSIIVGKLSSYARKNRTKRALWELDSIFRSLYLLDFIDSISLRRNVHRALGRGEGYHQLRRAISYASFGALRFKTEHEQQLWSECSRLIANCVIYYNAMILSGLLKAKEQVGDKIQIARLARVSPIAWQHINFQGRYTFRDIPEPPDIDALVQKLNQHPIGIIENLD